MCQQTTIHNRKAEEGVVVVRSCGLDRSIPKSVATAPDRGVRLDQYQSIVAQNNGIERRRRSSPAAISIASSSSCEGDDSDFEWYDLDAVREALPFGGSSSSNSSDDDCNHDHAVLVVDHDFNAGLVFTTTRQVLSKEAEANSCDSAGSSYSSLCSFLSASDGNHVIALSTTATGTSSGTTDFRKSRSCIVDGDGSNTNDAEKQQQQQPKFDFFFWLSNNNNSNNEPDDETPAEKDDRLFRERMDELEREINDA